MNPARVNKMYFLSHTVHSEAPTAWCDPHCDLWPPGTSSNQRPTHQPPATAAWLPHPRRTYQPQRGAASRGGGRARRSGRGGHGEYRHRADSRGQQWQREQEAELRRTGRDMQRWTCQRGASCCQSGAWRGTNDLLKPKQECFWMERLVWMSEGALL